MESKVYLNIEDLHKEFGFYDPVIPIMKWFPKFQQKLIYKSIFPLFGYHR